jgi:hypothetical protein
MVILILPLLAKNGKVISLFNNSEEKKESAHKRGL